MYQQRIKTLEESYKLIEQKINNKDGDLNTLYEQKAKYHQELSSLRKLQWEHDHERVEFDDR